jgi:hypothetical protein
MRAEALALADQISSTVHDFPKLCRENDRILP